MDEIRIGSHILQPNRQLLADGEHVHLGARALEILSLLAEAEGEIVTKDELFEAIWPGQIVEENALQAHIAAIRKALGEDANRLKTMRGVGYQLDVSGPSKEAGNGGEEAEDTKDETSHTKAEAHEPPAAITGRKPLRLIGTFLAILAALALVAYLAGWADSSNDVAAENSAEVTVYPFAPTSDDPQDNALAVGITEELITRLRRIPELRVLTGNDQSQNAQNAIHGRVRTDGDRLRVSARLEDANGAVIWSDNFDRELNDLLFVQEDIAASVADTLSVSLDVGVASRQHGGTDNPEAYVNFVRGRAARYNFDPREAIAYLERAVEIDPEYPRANAELIFAYGFRIFSATDEREVAELMDKMDRASSKAMESAPDLAVSHVARAWYHLAVNDFVSATRRMMRAEELDPGNDPDLKERMAAFASQFGRHERQKELLRQRGLIDPVLVGELRPGNAATQMLYARDVTGALEAYRSTQASGAFIIPLEVSVGYWASMLSGNGDAARSLPGLANFPDNAPVYREYRPGWHDAELFPDLAFPELEQWANERFGQGGAFGIAQLAVFAGHSGEHQLAIDYMRLAAQRPNVSGYFWFWHPALSETRRTDLFEQFLIDIGMAEAFRISGDWGDHCRPISEIEIACE